MKISRLSLLLALPLLASACTQTSTSSRGADIVQPLSRRGDGSPVAGLGREFHADRRAALRERLGTEGVVVIRGLPETRGYTEFRQDKTFWYLTGVESPDAALVMDLSTGQEILFLPGKSAYKEGWEGELWDSGDEWVRELTGIAEVRDGDTLMASLSEMIPQRGPVYVSMHPWVTVSGCFDRAAPADRRQEQDPLDGRVSREKALAGALQETFGAEVRDMTDDLAELRRVKTDAELAALRRAATSGAQAMIEAIASTADGRGEWELDALVGFEQALHGADGSAYHAIVGSGPNANVLHYSASSRRMKDGELLLIDAGGEVDHFTTDITRTWPVNGRFTPEQAALYDAVLAAQEAGIAMCRPGVTMREISDASNQVLRDRGYGDMIRHGVCHYVGMEVHDPGSYAAPLEPGVVITVEPGAYDDERGFGVRIEDVVVITEDGCEVITRGVPVEREAVEALVQRRGRLDG